MPVEPIHPDCVSPALAGLGRLLHRFSHTDGAEEVIGPPADELHVVTGFGPTNAPTAGSLSVMLGIVELQRLLNCPVTVVISELGAWNSRNVPWDQLIAVRDQMMAFLRGLGFDEKTGNLRSHLDPGNLARAGKIARFLTRQDFLDHREDLLDLYDSHGLLGSEIGLVVDALYTVADVLGPAESGGQRILMVSGLEEAYFTKLSRLVLQRQAGAGSLSLGWNATIGALYFRVLEGLAGYPKMSKSIPASSIHVGMKPDELRAKICTETPTDQAPLLAAIRLASGWPEEQVRAAETAHGERHRNAATWRAVKHDYLETFLHYADRWRQCG